MPTLIAIDGLDGSGKGTQSKLLYEALCAKGIPARLISFPVYDSPSCELVKLYLSGTFGTDPDSVNCFAASSFYAMDRFATYASDWKRDYEAGTIIIADRYTTANAIHQLSKLNGEAEKAEFLQWLSDFEYGKLGIPAPSMTLFLEVPVEMSLKLIEKRGREGDIHENREHLLRAFDAAHYAAKAWNWDKIVCAENGVLRTREEIAKEILHLVEERLPACR
ncbi:MAG: thymidylate kinase [Clostridia bacterium]|nr:thymidylate kinase [Clostridia bacterium]